MTVLFVSENTLERAENLRALFDAYDGEKTFEQGWESYVSGKYPVAVIDTMPPFMPDKKTTVVFIGHGMTGDKLYGFDQLAKYVDERVRGQIDYAICPSSNWRMRSIIASQTGCKRVLSLGFPRSDALVRNRGKLNENRTYFYAPTFRGINDGLRLPRIDWKKLDSLLEDDERIIVKRHYFQNKEIVGCECARIAEVEQLAASTPYLITCDVLISDYSSIIFDAYVCGKPVVLTIDDSAEYSMTRGMYLNYPKKYSSRWLKVEGNEAELVDMLREASRNGMTESDRNTRDFVANMCDGHSCERICELIGTIL